MLDSSALVTLLLKRPGDALVKALIADPANSVRLHLQNATEVRYIMHRHFALAAWLARHPERLHPHAGGRPDLTGLDLDDPAVFDFAAGSRSASATMNDLVAAGIVIEGESEHPDLWIRASELKSRFRRVSLADCFGLALSIEHNAPFYSSDHHELDAVQDAGAAQIVFIR